MDEHKLKNGSYILRLGNKIALLMQFVLKKVT